MESALKELERENASLREEVRRLEVYQLMAYRDDLTALHNRRYFDERLEQELSRGQRWNAPCAVLLLDIDKFKVINDSYGHLVGDAVIQAVAQFIRGAIRSIDVAARVGGDEFAIILPNTDHATVGAVSQRLQQPIHVPGRNLKVQLSVGSATFPVSGATRETLLHWADRDMYAHKKRERERTSTPSP
jgi:diguanylate cyclase (GGDEF)-like protein